MTTDSGKSGTPKMNGRAYANDLATRIAAEMRRQSKAREIVHMSDEVCLSLALQAAEIELTAMTARCEKAEAHNAKMAQLATPADNLRDMFDAECRHSEIMRNQLTESRRANAQISAALAQLTDAADDTWERGSPVAHLDTAIDVANDALLATSADHKKWEEGLFGDAVAFEFRWIDPEEGAGMWQPVRGTRELDFYKNDPRYEVRELFAKSKPKGGA